MAFKSKRPERLFLCPDLRERNHMTKDKDNKPNDEVIIVTDDAGMQLYLSEKAANRLSWILTGIMAALCLPVIILAFMCI